jgi:WD40 repeat protein
VTTTHRTHPDSNWFARFAIAAGLSLFTVCFFIALLGVVFLTVDDQRLSKYVSVLQSLDVRADGSTVSLFWTMDESGQAGWQHHLALHAPDSQTPSPLISRQGVRPFAIAAGPDSNQLLLGTWDGQVQLLDLRNSQADPLCLGRQHDGAVTALALTGDHTCVVSQSGFGLHAWNLASCQERWRIENLATNCFALRPDSSAVLVGTTDGRLLEIDLANGQNRRVVFRHHAPILGSTFSPDGTKLALMRSDSTLLLLDGSTLNPLWERHIHRLDRTAPGRMTAFSPCSTLLVTAGQEDGSALCIWNANTGDQLRELRGHRKVVQGATFVTGRALRSWAADGTIRVWDIESGTTQQIHELAPPKTS